MTQKFCVIIFFSISAYVAVNWLLLSRIAVHNADYAVARCLSDRLSHAQYSVKTAERILKLFSLF